MTNYEKALQLLNSGIARKHYTYEQTGYIILDLGGQYAGYISPLCRHVEVSKGGIHLGYGNIDIDKMMVFDMLNREKYNLTIKKWEDAE